MSNKLLPVLYVPPTYELKLRSPYGNNADYQLKVLHYLMIIAGSGKYSKVGNDNMKEYTNKG